MVLIALVFVGQTLNVIGPRTCDADIREGWKQYCQVVGRPVTDPVFGEDGVPIYVRDVESWTGGFTVYSPTPHIRLYPRALALYPKHLRSAVVAHELCHYLRGLRDHPHDRDYGCVMGDFGKFKLTVGLCEACRRTAEAN